MALAKRIIACLDMNRGRVVKGISFVSLRDAGDPIQLAKQYAKEGADELVLLDISASNEGRSTMLNVVRSVASVLDIPFTVGGGVRTLDEALSVLEAGADKVSINTAAVADPTLIESVADVFGRQCVVLAVDARRVTVTADRNSDMDYASKMDYEVVVQGGRTPTGKCVLDWCRQATALGAGEILLTSMDCDGHRQGYDLVLTRRVAETVNVPVIASGGAGSPHDIFEVLTEGRADAALAASIFHYGEYSLCGVKSYLKDRGVEIRPCEML